jgi:acyl-coenzyme A synthetase/AMP-(fatty) acid ligase
LAERVGGLSGELCDQGVADGDRVALALPDAPSWVVAFLALMRVGAVAALVPGNLPRDRFPDVVGRAWPVLMISNDPGLSPRTPSICPRGPSVGHGRDPGPAATRGTDSAYLLLTSGSTGPPKWAIHRHRDIPSCLATYGRHVLRLRPTDVTYSSASLASSYGLGNSLYFPIGAGACAWIDGERPSPSQAAAACVAGGITVMLGVPTFWARLARHVADGRVEREAFAGVRLAVSAGEPLPEAVFDAVRRHVGLELVDGLGSSEATNLYLSNRPGGAIRGSVGHVVPGFDVRVCDVEDNPVTPGQVGQLLVRGDSVMAGYLGEPVATAQTLLGGWLHTGDLVQRRDDGAYRFVGRVGDRFKSGGLWVDPHRVAGVMAQHPAVAEVAVVGVPDQTGVVRVVAVVAAEHGNDGELDRDLATFAASRLARHEVPRAFAIVPELPTAPSGEVRRDETARLAAKALTGGPSVVA